MSKRVIEQSTLDELLAAAKAAWEHVNELREAWRTGALSEHDGQGGTRSNRNAAVEVALRNAITRAGEPKERRNEMP